MTFLGIYGAVMLLCLAWEMYKSQRGKRPNAIDDGIMIAALSSKSQWEYFAKLLVFVLLLPVGEIFVWCYVKFMTFKHRNDK